MANLIMLGALVQATRLVSLDTIGEQLEAHLSERHRKWLEPTKKELAKGAGLG